ncbi:VanZ family protein [Iningainema tapete]|uniref:VanZ family protein n=1 Tax=Iningainema tapete BLCC-T55 TaxID=2748662 RepID=A0A8J6XG20_9CYAN|nr:VanZ family protein [Iningainema tapete]MBD2776090.1 VanZ family protein [Iningainema tapete BLCC-T55]
MKRGNIFSSVFNLSEQPVSLIDIILVFFSSILVILATLYPFNFSFNSNLSWQQLIESFNNTSLFQDQVNNVLLFMPVGFTVTNVLQKTRMKPIVKIFIVILASAGLSFTVELLQVFLPSRQPTPEDILNNTIGGCFGFLSFYTYNSRTITHQNIRVRHSAQKITAFFAGYIFLTFILAILWQNTTNLSTWSLNYHLLLGNEQIGDRPWQGYIYKVDIADKSVTEKEVSQIFTDETYFTNIGDSLLASYQLNNECCYQDQTGKLSRLVWRGKPTETQFGEGVFFNSTNWLESSAAVTSLNKKISETSEFTISTTVASGNTNQTGPARIVSISRNSVRRNFTLGQQGSDLDLRIRTPITGKNGSEFKLNVPGIFADTNPHHIVVTYSKATVQVYVDKLQNYYSFNLLELMPKEHKIFYYALTFIPLGFCLALVTTLAKRRVIFYRLLLLNGIILPSVILESVLVSESGKSISLNSIILSVFFTTVTMLLFKVRSA